MNNLPRSVEDMIYKDVEGMNRLDLHKELMGKFYFCTECEELKNETINQMDLYCRLCDKTVCDTCPLYPDEYKNNICHNCQLQERYLDLLKKIINIDIYDQDRFLYLLYEHNYDEDTEMYDDIKLHVIRRLRSIYDKGIKYTKQELHDLIHIMVREFSIEDWS